MSYDNVIWHLLFKFCMALVLVFGVIGLGVGIGLIVAGPATFRFFNTMNRWVSMRGPLKPMERPRDTERFAHRHRRSIGALLVAGGVFATFGLATRIKASAVAAMLAKGTMLPVIAIAAESLKWFLIVGSICGVVVGFMLCFRPDGLAAIEKHANRWISSRRFTRGENDMHLTLDKLVEAHPGPSGWIFICTALGVAIYSAAMLFTRF